MSGFGRYKILDRLGSGAMGEVYKAEDTRVFDKIVAIKVLSDRLSQNQTAVRRFETEVKTAATLDHPNIVSISDRGEAEDGRPYFVMEYLEGFDLAALTSGKEKRSLEVLVELARQVADALNFAHAARIVHRDVKPSNVFVVKRGDEEQAKLLDFGIVHVEGSDMTRTTDQPGTYNYMAPEVMSGVEADSRSDLFSLGIVLYELFTQVHPFAAPTQPLILGRILNDKPERPRKVNPEIPSQLEAIILRLLEKDPEQRPPRAKEIVDALRVISANLRSTGVDTSGGDVSADDVAQQAVRAWKDIARRKEADGDLPGALAFWRKISAVAPDDARAQRKIEKLQHDMERTDKLTTLLDTARSRMQSSDLPGARAAWHEAWLLAPEEPKVLDLKVRLETAESEQEPEDATLAPAVANAVALYTSGEPAKKNKARAAMIGYLRTHPEDKEAARILDDILAGRPVTITGAADVPAAPPKPPAPAPPKPPEAPPKPAPPPPEPPAAATPPPKAPEVAWSASDRKKLDRLDGRLAIAASAAADVAPGEAEAVEAARAKVREVAAGAPATGLLESTAEDVRKLVEQVGGAVSASATRLADAIDARRARTAGAIEADVSKGAAAAAADLRGLQGEAAVERGPALIETARSVEKGLERAAAGVVDLLKRRVGALPGGAPAALRDQVDRWSIDGTGATLSDVLAAVQAAEGQASAGIANEIRDWAAKVRGAGVLDEAVLGRFLSIATDLESGGSGTKDRARVGRETVDALRKAHAQGFERIGSEFREVSAEALRLRSFAPKDRLSQLDEMVKTPLSDDLGTSAATLATLRAEVERLRAVREEREREGRERLAKAVTAARKHLEDPWLESAIDDLDQPGPEATRLLTAARAGSTARAALEAALQAASDDRQPAADRLRAVEESAKQATAAAAAAKKAHVELLEGFENRRAATATQLEKLRGQGLPKKMRARAESIELPKSAGPGPAGTRAYVHGVEAAMTAVADLRRRIDEIRPELTAEAGVLLAAIGKVGGMPRWPRISGDLRERVDAARGRLEKVTARPDADLVELVEAVESGRDAVDDIPRNLLPIFAGAMLAAAIAATGWLILAKRVVVLERGLGASEVWLIEPSDGSEVRGEVLEDGSVRFRVGTGDYAVRFGAEGEEPRDGGTVSLGLFSGPAPLEAERRVVGEQPRDRALEVLGREFPDLLADPAP